MLKGVVFLSLVCVALAGSRWENLQTKPSRFANTPGCYVRSLNTVLSVGQSAPSRHVCQEYVCDTYKLKVNTCDEVYAEPPCYVEQGAGPEYSPYPGCCPKRACGQRH